MNLQDIRKDFITELDSVINYEHLGKLILEALIVFHKNVKLENPNAEITQVCGPISTGGLGSIQKNIEFFKESIEKLKNAGYIVFDQTPFEEKIWEIKESRRLAGRWFHYDHLLLEKIYKPLFESGLLDLVVFLPDYQSSVGAKWEYDQSFENRIKIIHWEFFDKNLKISTENILLYFLMDFIVKNKAQKKIFFTKNFNELLPVKEGLKHGFFKIGIDNVHFYVQAKDPLISQIGEEVFLRIKQNIKLIESYT